MDTAGGYWIFYEPGSRDLSIVYVDDFLLSTFLGPIRDALLQALKEIWTLAKEKILTIDSPITFLGIDLQLAKNGDLTLTHKGFTQQLLEKHGLGDANPIRCIQMGPLPPGLDVPTPKVLKELQVYRGGFNWLATRTRTDLSYYVSILASASSRYAA